MNKQQLASRIWESANKMRSKIEANEYKDYILGFIFYKFLSDKEVEFLKKNDWEVEDFVELVEEDIETVNQCKKNLGYFIAYDHLFSTWLSMGKDFDVSNVTDALSAFERLINESHRKVFDGVFDTLQTGLSKLGETSNARTKAISDLIQLIKDIPMDEKQGYDVLGFIYEYLISNFAANAGKKAGEFYTPHEVSLLISEIVANHLKDRDHIAIYDPTSGSGSLLINIGHSASKYMNRDSIQYYAQELKENTYNLTRMNLIMRGINPSNLFTRNADTLEDDWPIDIGSYPPVLRVDAVVSNPPYSQQWNPDGKESDPRYCEYGLAPKGKADYAFLLHDLYHLKPDGIMAIVLPHGVLFRGGEEEKIRTNLIEKNHIDAIIGLPANIFFGTGIPTIIMVLKQKREQSDVLIIDASKGFVKSGKNNILRASDIKRIVDTYTERKTVEKYAKLVSRDEIRTNGYNLNIPRYVDSSEKAESWDLYASMMGGIPNAEIDDLAIYWQAFPELKDQLFVSNDTSYSELRSKDISHVIENSEDVKGYIERYEKRFEDFEEYLKERLICQMEEVQPVKEEIKIGNNIFARLADIPLVDKYHAYQVLDDEWIKIAIDFDIIGTEGKAAVKVVEPNLIMKKDKELQEGWKGRILPFDLVQGVFLSDQLAEIKEKERRIEEIISEYEEMIEEMAEEDKESEILNEAQDAFQAKGVTARLKELKHPETEDEKKLKEMLEQYTKLSKEEKETKKEIKDLTAALHIKTKETIESLTDIQAEELLVEKWIRPLQEELMDIPRQVIGELIKQVRTLGDKYETTLIGIEKEIKEVEKSLVSMLDELCGNESDMKGIASLKALLGGE
ncbi:type I restriction-modification system subunit M [Faecalicatena contorta]|uniref:type I restriction-modification system subunit M n=1 Tax=Faecalicatena contorta TaxID=39482 RepID=UPI001F262EF2|nr:type I restriction-modification system subunit M [Faecalicatena contorta]MCF2682107.1 type I restriction-modification system subunit M [Faecalicatena contorta]